MSHERISAERLAEIEQLASQASGDETVAIRACDLALLVQELADYRTIGSPEEVIDHFDALSHRWLDDRACEQCGEPAEVGFAEDDRQHDRFFCYSCYQDGAGG
jgi:formylmethanofuran dehydrogenase subunit E